MEDAIPTPAETWSHFGLTQMPFSNELPTGQLWRAPDHDERMNEVLSAVSCRLSAAVIAPSGTGKTVLLRSVVDRLPETRYQTIDVKVTAVSHRDFYRDLTNRLGLQPVGTWPRLLDEIQAYARTLLSVEARRLVILVDEAQDMRPEVLATLRMLINFELDSERVISVLLVGDTSLDKLLHRPDMEPLRSRIALVTRLGTLSRDQARSYIDHRLDLVGARTQILDDSAVEAVFDFSRGNLRAIDHLCRTALTIAAKNKLSTVDAGLVTIARKKLP